MDRNMAVRERISAPPAMTLKMGRWPPTQWGVFVSCLICVRARLLRYRGASVVVVVSVWGWHEGDAATAVSIELPWVISQRMSLYVGLLTNPSLLVMLPAQHPSPTSSISTHRCFFQCWGSACKAATMGHILWHNREEEPDDLLGRVNSWRTKKESNNVHGT